MTDRDRTREAFLTHRGSLFGLFLLNRLPFVGGMKPTPPQAAGSYGTHPYGGATSK